MGNRQEQFLEWLSNQVSPTRLSDYGLVLVELETFAKTKKIISGSIFDVNDPATTGKIVNALTMDRFYRFMHKKDLRWITELAQYLHRYAKENAETGSKLTEPADPISSVPNQTYADAVAAPQPAEKAVVPEGATEAEQTVDFTRPADYTFSKPVSVSYFGDVYPISSWRVLYAKVCRILLEDYPQVFEALRSGTLSSNYNYLIYDEVGSKKLLAPIEIESGFYVEVNRSAADLIRNIRKLLDACNVDYENLVITYIRKNTATVRPAKAAPLATAAIPVGTGRDSAVQAAGERGNDEENTKPAPRYKLETASTQYYGTVPAEAFARFCEHVAYEHPLAFRSLLDVKYNGTWSVVLSRTAPSGDAVPMHDPSAYISRDLTEQAVIAYSKWICSVCGEADIPLRITELSAAPAADTASPSRPAAGPGTALNNGAAVQPVPLRDDIINHDAARAEKIVLPADLAGMTIEQLSLELRTSIVSARKAVAASPRLVQLGDKIVHQDAFVDWEDGADRLEKILDKLLDRNDGYVSAAQLYDFAHAEMQMFLNDNDMDDARLVYDMARHLFEKAGYHGKRLVFQSNAHISCPDKAVTNLMDLMRSYALSQGGIFREADLVQYLRHVGVNSGNLTTGNLHVIMKFYTDPIFMLYDSGQLILGESMNIDATWFADVQNALQKLFADMGDHVVMRDIQPWWFSLLPVLPTGRPWTLLLLQSILFHYSKQLGGAHTIGALHSQSLDTIHAMLVSGDSEVQSFADAVIAFLVDDGVDQRDFEAEELRLRLVHRGMVAGNELIWNMPKALANDARFVWSADGQRVLVKV